MRKLLLSLFTFLIFQTSFLILTTNHVFAVCGMAGKFCQNDSTCQPSDKPDCASYVCNPDPSKPLETPGGICQPPSTPTPTLPPAPACSKARDTCERHKECQPSDEEGCKSYYCLTDRDNPQLPRGSCQFKPAFIPPGTPFQPDCVGENPIDPTDLKKGYKNYKCQTAIGEINTNPEKLVAQALNIILGLAGGIALLLIIFSGYQMATSAGNPEKLQGARETLTSAIVGLVFIILSISILRIIGIEILAIPGLDVIFKSMFR